MDNTYYVRTSSTSHNGIMYNDTYITTYRNGLEYICHGDGNAYTLLSYADKKKSRIIGKSLSLDEARKLCANTPTF